MAITRRASQWVAWPVFVVEGGLLRTSVQNVCVRAHVGAHMRLAQPPALSLELDISVFALTDALLADILKANGSAFQNVPLFNGTC